MAEGVKCSGKLLCQVLLNEDKIPGAASSLNKPSGGGTHNEKRRQYPAGVKFQIVL